MGDFPSQSKYRSIISVVDDNGEPFNIDAADSVEYFLSKRRGGDPIFTIDDSDPDFSIDENGDLNVANIFIPANTVDMDDVVWEELWVNLNENQQSVVAQRPVAFFETVDRPLNS